ncbi:hypothetical protein [Actinosynnema sp. ALI-1.44]|uniref:hypothetical protein n=1 Tax=Actinosynnema sp. ALI-1.44 TaxID=1933779 RepID=UPI00117843C5|nr:hypothetical protein [Actinosynnema sp. ALI-1.44]
MTLLVGFGSTAAANPGGPEATAAGVKRTGFFVFEKNKANPSNSRLAWQEWTMVGDRPPRKTLELRWRAGSGNGSTDSCASNAGWLPNGTYGGTYMTGFDGDINGIVFQLDNKKCGRNGTERSALFIHSEMMPNGKQNSNVESERWDGPIDYFSEGCVKLKPADIKQAAKRYRAFYGGSADQRKSKLLVVTNG